ncbi:MAG: TIGR03790 family protein [Myxococcota bacterium]|nr:TIGR03790 family protein [Myxococcota bacterium]
MTQTSAPADQPAHQDASSPDSTVPGNLPTGPPVAEEHLLTGLEDQPLVLLTGVGNGFEVLVPPQHGHVVPDETAGTVTYTPTPRWNGFDRFTYRLTNDLGSAEGSVGLTIYTSADPGAPQVLVPQLGLRAEELGVVMNGQDPRSVEIGEAYADARGIPPENLVVVDVPTEETTLTAETFAPIYDLVHDSLPPNAQAIAVAWTRPWAVDCMSMTSALALGFDPMYCGGEVTDGKCGGTAPVPTYLSQSERMYDDHGIRPAMMLAGETTADVLATVVRGVASDRTRPMGTAYLVRTSDVSRNVRWSQMTAALLDWAGVTSLSLAYLDNSDGDLGSDVVMNMDDALFYFTGLISVDGLETNTYVPGALGDHLTSYGGQLTGSDQMSALRWLEAGVVASYGTVVEPCNLLDKFPNVRFVMQLYTRGETALEAYWKSVKTPGEGIFIGDPLANPWGRHVIRWDDDTLSIETSMLRPGQSLRIEAADHLEGPWDEVVNGLTAPDLGPALFTVESDPRSFYRILRDSSL